jgi:MFS family permease
MTTAAAPGDAGAVRSLIPFRMDRLPWARFHWMVVLGLGTAWILDGLEIQLVASAGYQNTLNMSSTQVGLTGTVYLIGQVVGALFFGRLTDTLGRKRLFIITLAIYLIGSGVAGLAWNMWWLWIWRFVAGLGIGGEYTAINSAIDELIPAKYRGRVDIAINGTYWFGAMIGAFGNIFLLNHDLVAENWGWRIGFFIGPVLGLVIIWLRRHIPESPRWMVTHGHGDEAERIVDEIEQSVKDRGGELTPVDESKAMMIKAKEQLPWSVLSEVFFKKYPRRTFLGITMMVTQSFLYNAIFFTYILVLKNFYDLEGSTAEKFFFPFAVGNLLGPLLLGHFFDTIGRRKMICGTYVLSGGILVLSALLFRADALTPTTQTLLWCGSFFFASAGASSAYLTVSEIFPLEVRGQAISYFFSIGQVVGAFGPTIYGALIGEGTDRTPLFWGYILGAGVMIFGGLVAWFFGVNAEGQSLEDVADPLSRVHDEPPLEPATA